MLETKFLREIFDNLGEPVFVFSASDMRVVLANRAGASLVGIEDPAAGSMRCHHLFCRNEQPCRDREDPCPVRTVLGTRASAHFLRSVRGPGGTDTKMAVLASPIADGTGAIDRVVVTLRDAMWSGLDTEKLARYARQAEERGRLKGLLNEILGHDLLNPASVIRYCADTLSEQEKDPRKVMLWGMLKKNLSWLIQIVENTARLTRVENPGDLELRELDLAVLFGSIVGYLEPQWREKGLDVEFLGPGPFPVLANPMLADAFLNVFSNAVKYTPEGGAIQVTVEDGGESWIVRVSDTGPGIPGDCKERVFDPYERLGLNTVRGKGLGLTIARRIMDIHGGDIVIEDGPGGGTVFRLAVRKAPPP